MSDSEPNDIAQKAKVDTVTIKKNTARVVITFSTSAEDSKEKAFQLMDNEGQEIAFNFTMLQDKLPHTN